MHHIVAVNAAEVTGLPAVLPGVLLFEVRYKLLLRLNQCALG
jgi:hypothetical protein